MSTIGQITSLSTVHRNSSDPRILETKELSDLQYIKEEGVVAVHLKGGLPTTFESIARVGFIEILDDMLECIDRMPRGMDALLGWAKRQENGNVLEEVCQAANNFFDVSQSLKTPSTRTCNPIDRIRAHYNLGGPKRGSHTFHPDSTDFTLVASLFGDGVEYIVCQDITPDEIETVCTNNAIIPGRMTTVTGSPGDIIALKGRATYSPGQPERDERDCLLHRSPLCDRRFALIFDQP